MKYLKLFEKQKNRSDLVDSKLISIFSPNKKYWLVPTDNRFEEALIKIDYNDKVANFVFGIRKRIKKWDFINKNYIFLSSEISKEGKEEYGWMPYEDKLPDAFYEKEGYKFSGFVNMEEYELELNKYNL